MGKITDLVAKDLTTFTDAISQLSKEEHHLTYADVEDAFDQFINRIETSLTFSSVEWAPELQITIFGPRVPAQVTDRGHVGPSIEIVKSPPQQHGPF